MTDFGTNILFFDSPVYTYQTDVFVLVGILNAQGCRSLPTARQRARNRYK